MAFTPEQAEQIKQQIYSQIETSQLPNKEEIKKQIQDMNEEQLEEFVKQQQGQAQQGESSDSQQCIFCSITKGETPSYKLDENKKSIAILEINPLSKGHAIILPLDHINSDKLPASAMSLARKISKKIKTKLKPLDIKIETSSFQGHSMINIIPIYKDQQLEKKQASEDELKKLQEQLIIKKRASRTSKLTSTTSTTSLPKISFRIP